MSDGDPAGYDALPKMTDKPAVVQKPKPVPLVRAATQAQKQAQKQIVEQPVGAAAVEQAVEAGGGAVQTQAQAAAARLAQIVNLHIGGYSLAQIGASIGASADEVDRMLAQDAQRYVRSQPALRVYVRNYVSERYSKLLDAVWDDAVDMTPQGKITVQGFDKKLASQDRAIKILDRMAKLHGADAPTQAEVKVEAAPEAVEKLVHLLSQSQGLGYDMDIFDVVDAEVVHDAVAQSESATLDASEMVGEDQPGDENWGDQP